MAQATIIDGRKVADEIRNGIKDRVQSLEAQGVTPGLAVVLVGEDPASQVYVRMKGKACEKLGIHEKTITLPADISESELLDLIDELNRNDTYHGILIQMPLPDHIDSDKVILAVNPEKDVDGFHPVNIGKLVLNQEGFIACTPHGILKLLQHYNVETDGASVVVVGRSNIVGKPITNLLYQKAEFGNATVTICHTHTREIATFTRRADILIAAAGVPEFIRSDMIKPGAAVIDVGSNRVDAPGTKKGYKFVGDVDFEHARKVAGYITPVPGGVGPMTITMLLHNTVWSAEQQLT